MVGEVDCGVGPGLTARPWEPERLDRADARELIARVLAPSMSHSAKTAAIELLEKLDLAEASRLSAEALERDCGISRSQARRLAAAFALGRRVERGSGARRPRLHSAERIFRLMAPELRGRQKETFHALLVDSKHRLRRKLLVSEGTLNGGCCA